nr:PASTA domain-containing protein [Micromonospora sp. AMSO31t]
MPRGPAGDADATRKVPREPAGDEDADATRAMPSTPSGGGDGDATRPMPRGDGGAGARRPIDATTRQEPVSPAWSGRAGVPPPRAAGYPEPGGEWYTEEQAGRRWWMPILLGVLALVLIALIGLGVWLALRAADRDAEPGLSPSAAPTAARTSATPSTAAPSSSPPSSPPTTTAAAEVPMPPLVGLPESAARAALDQLGVDYRVRYRTSDRRAGTVIETSPGAGEPVEEGDRVSIVVARAAEPTTTPTTSTPSPTATATP